MIIESGVIVALGLLFMFMKLRWKYRMLMLSNPVATDVVVFIFVNIIHWGSFTGVMAAATAAMICSGMLTVGRWAFGYVEKRMYFPGVWNIVEKIK